MVNAIAAHGEDYFAQDNLATDDGRHRNSGEAALVPHRFAHLANPACSFTTTLYDENAACHLALGTAACASPMQDGMTPCPTTKFTARGGNLSNIHIDFMIGSGQIDIDGRL